MKRLLFLPVLLLTACTATEQTTETSAARSVPTEVRTDADRQAIYDNGRNTRTSAVPDATPNTQRLGEQAADINRRKRVESINTNDPNTTAPETRLRRQNEIPAATTAPQ
jgi:negative regulator of replication initiation